MSWSWLKTCCPGQVADVVAPNVAPTFPYVPPTFVPLANYTYSTGQLPDPLFSGGTGQSTYVSAVQQLSAGSGATTLTFNSDIDDLAVMIPASASVTASQNMTTGTTTAVLPSNALVLTPVSGAFTYAMTVDQGTKSATIPQGTTGGASILSAAGITVLPSTASIPLAQLRSLGMADAYGNLTFLWVLVPSGSGHINISGGSTT